MEKGSSDRGVNPQSATLKVCAALNRAGSKYLVIGGIACVLHGYVRATTDVDILIERTLENARNVLGALEGLGWGHAGEWRGEEILKRPITVIGDDPALDIFTVAWSVKYADAVKRSSVVEVEGVAIPLIGIDDLIETKRTDRPLDTADIEALMEIKRLRGETR
jgi:hypothetical protein